MGQIFEEKAFLVSAYFEGLVYGISAIMFLSPHFNLLLIVTTFSMHSLINVSIRLDQLHILEMPELGIIFLETVFLELNKLSVVLQHDIMNKLIDISYMGTMELQLEIIILPILLLTINMISGILFSVAYVVQNSYLSSTVLQGLIWTYESVAFTLTVITVGLMSYQIWITHRNAANYHVGEGRLLSIMWILIESAALQIVTKFLLMVLYISQDNSPYIVLLDCITPIVGITFNSITVCVKLQSLEAGIQAHDANIPVQTIGSMPLGSIRVNIMKEIADDRRI
ncbi:hypothetical protein BDQ17DRAFT_1435073 [Cyathus striatus]|nr:hypothetical protein BDQ17DRAFT_1435073 [Cyathus striatus]